MRFAASGSYVKLIEPPTNELIEIPTNTHGTHAYEPEHMTWPSTYDTYEIDNFPNVFFRFSVSGAHNKFLIRLKPKLGRRENNFVEICKIVSLITL